MEFAFIFCKIWQKAIPDQKFVVFKFFFQFPAMNTLAAVTVSLSYFHNTLCRHFPIRIIVWLSTLNTITTVHNTSYKTISWDILLLPSLNSKMCAINGAKLPLAVKNITWTAQYNLTYNRTNTHRVTFVLFQVSCSLE